MNGDRDDEIRVLPPRAINWSRTLSLWLSLAYLGGAALLGGSALLLRVALFLILPFASIWWGEAMGSMVGPGTAFLAGGAGITKPTPGCVVVVVGWVLLLAPLVWLAILSLGWYTAR